MQNKMVSLVIPAFNEESIIGQTIEKAVTFLSAHFDSFELIIADDGSTDGTKAVVCGMEIPQLRLVSYSPNRGKGYAIRQGVLAAEGDYIVYTDADLAYGLESVADIIELLMEKDADIALGSRKLHPDGYADYPPLRLAASHCFSFLTGLFAGFHYDTQCGIKAFRSSDAKRIFSLCQTDGFAFDFEAVMLAKRLNMSICQLPVTIINHRESKVDVMRDSIRMFGDIIKIRRRVNNMVIKEN